MGRLKSNEIIKVLEVLIGEVEAVGDSNADERRLENLKTLIDVTNWCLDGLVSAMESGQGRVEYSMKEIGYTARGALDYYYRIWLNNLLGE